MEDIYSRLIMVVLTTLVQVLLPVLCIAGIGWLAMRIREIRLGLGERRWGLVMQAVMLGISSAEQSGLAGLIANEGKVKKAYALDAAERYLRQYGLRVDLDVLADAIEAVLLSTDLTPIKKAAKVEGEPPG